MKNAEELRNNLSAVFQDLREGKIKHAEAAELANLAEKMINSTKVQIEYYSLIGEKPFIEFLSVADKSSAE